MSDDELLRHFQACTLPYAEWTHRAHVRVAYLYLQEHGFEGALPLVRAGIQAYNASQQIPEGPTSGYNETTTQAFLHLVAATMAAYGKAFPTSDSEAFCNAHPQLLTRQVLRLYYSPEQRMRPEAKLTFVPPDLAPLPAILSRSTSFEPL